MNTTLIEQPSRELIQKLITQSKQYSVMGDFELQFDSEQTFALYMKRNSKIIAGVIGIVTRDWAYVETLWVDESLRGQGVGKRLMLATETYVHQLGLNGIFLYTVDFQAPYFYPKLGYQVFGKLPNRPQGYNATYFAKTALEADALTDEFTVENPVTESTFEILESGLDQHAEDITPIISHERVFLQHDEDGHIIGGIFGHVFWGWLDVHLCYATTSEGVDQLLDTLEQFCDTSQLGIITHTYDQAQGNRLQARGYPVFGTLPNRPTDTTCTIWIRSAAKL